MMFNSMLSRCRVVCNINTDLVLRYCFTIVPRPNDQFKLMKEKLLANTSCFSPEFIANFRQDVLVAGNRINTENFDSLFMEACIQNNFYELGKQFFHHLHERNGKISLALIRKYFRLCFLMRDTCDRKDKEFLLSLYDQVSKTYPLLDDITCEQLSMGLSLTEKWTEGIKLLNMSKEYGKPTNQLYSSIIKASFDNGDESLGWKLLEEMIGNEMNPNEYVYSSILSKLYDSSIVEFLRFIEKNDLNLPTATCNLLVKHKGGNVTNISHEGACQHCRKRLLPIILNENEFKDLTEDFLKPVLIGKNIFIKTKPSELNNFKIFLANSPKVNVVLDGLNIAYAGQKKYSSPITTSKMLMNVVKYFIKKRLRVMVLGRRHMRKWTSSHMNFINGNASVFLADDLSSDDSFLLYATMYNGLGTMFVSRDLMRGHKFLLQTPEKKKLFSKWQQKHQLFLNHVAHDGMVYLKGMGSYLMQPQCNEGTWHIPIVEANQPGVQPHIQALSRKWLCIHLDE